MTYNQEIDRERFLPAESNVLYFRDSLAKFLSPIFFFVRRDLSSRRYESILRFLLLEEITILTQYKVCVSVCVYVSVHADVAILELPIPLFDLRVLMIDE